MVVRGAEVAYRIVAAAGPWLTLTPGGRRGHEEIARIAERIAASGYRVLLHDRRNTGASDFCLTDDASEEAMWADDLADLLGRLGVTRAFVGGFSSGSRMSMLVALRHPGIVRGLLLCRVTGGETAARRLPHNYYGQFIDAARAGGMPAVVAMPQYQERIAANPANEARLLSLDAADYIATMSRWHSAFLDGIHHPVMGVGAQDLARIAVPTLVIPGNDRTHSSQSGRAAATGIPGAVLFDLGLGDDDADIIPFPAWEAHEPTIAEAFVGFMAEHAGG